MFIYVKPLTENTSRCIFIQNQQGLQMNPSTTPDLLHQLRVKRNFDIRQYISKKTKLINSFFSTEGLNSCVLGLSGGVDSSVALALLLDAANEPDSPIKIVLGLSLPINSIGSTGQLAATDKANQLASMFRGNVKFVYDSVDLSNACEAYHENIPASGFAVGQLLSIVRTPYMYFRAAILQDNGYKSIVCGTTNRDEGGIIGFYGKASDGMNDLQPLADLHKSEVYKLAEYYKIPIDIINDIPRGDVYDGRTDSEMIGASYDTVELFTLCSDYGINIDSVELDPDVVLQLCNIQNLIKTNSHKYKVGLPECMMCLDTIN